MPDKTWKDVWTRKAGQHEGENYSLEKLMELDGYDISCSSVSADDFVKFSEKLIEKLELRPCQSVAEIGCGAGALCKVLADKGFSVGGVDYTDSLVEICKKAIPEGTFVAGEAADFELPQKDYDAMVSHSVFHYFPSDEYGVQAFRTMVAHTKPGGIIALTDMHDKRTEEEHHAKRKEMIGEKEYERLYAELNHHFYHPDIFAEAAQEICSEHWLEDQFLASESGKFKFNFFARR